MERRPLYFRSAVVDVAHYDESPISGYRIACTDLPQNYYHGHRDIDLSSDLFFGTFREQRV
jgi:hypothetical protein